MNDKVQQIAANAWFTVVGRSMMILTPIILAYVGNNIINMQTEIRILKVTIDSQRLTIDSLSTTLYRASDAVRDIKLLQIQIDESLRRINTLETKKP